MFTFDAFWDTSVWELVSLGTQVQPQIILNPECLQGYLSDSYEYGHLLRPQKMTNFLTPPQPPYLKMNNRSIVLGLETTQPPNTWQISISDFRFLTPPPPSPSASHPPHPLPCGRHKRMLLKVQSKLMSNSLPQFCWLTLNKFEVPFWSEN